MIGFISSVCGFASIELIFNKEGRVGGGGRHMPLYTWPFFHGWRGSWKMLDHLIFFSNGPLLIKMWILLFFSHSKFINLSSVPRKNNYKNIKRLLYCLVMIQVKNIRLSFRFVWIQFYWIFITDAKGAMVNSRTMDPNPGVLVEYGVW